MPQRLAAAMSMLAFAVCLVAGLTAGNTAATVLANALEAMGVTLLVGLVVGVMGRKMIEENVSALKAKQRPSDAAATGSEKIPGKSAAKPAGEDR